MNNGILKRSIIITQRPSKTRSMVSGPILIISKIYYLTYYTRQFREKKNKNNKNLGARLGKRDLFVCLFCVVFCITKPLRYRIQQPSLAHPSCVPSHLVCVFLILCCLCPHKLSDFAKVTLPVPNPYLNNYPYTFPKLQSPAWTCILHISSIN